jgi:uncharacterized protein (TIGR02996 family)
METAFLRAITDDPDDLVPRLAYADWLSEQNDPLLIDRGEFLRAQFALADITLPAEERRRLLERQETLLLAHRERWDEPFRHLALSWEYRNGFAERVTLNCEQLFVGFTDLVARAPVVRVRLRGLTPATATDLASSEGLAHLRELVLERELVTGAALAALLRSPHLARLRYLNLARNDVGDDGARALVASGAFRRLRYLNLSHTGLSRACVRGLLNAVALGEAPALRWLLLHGAPREAPFREYPSLPATLPLRLRQSIQNQLGLPVPPRPNLLRELAATAASLPPDLRRWVQLLQGQPAKNLPQALAQVPLPEAVHRAFAAVCSRRAVWRAHRAGKAPAAFPAGVETSARELTGAVTLLIGMADPRAEAAALADCLLDLFLRHQRGELPPDGKTR